MREAPDILHVDLDAFYASVESARDPSLRGRPHIVGGRGPRGVVLSCSYEARASGVRNGMPSARARRLCPDAAFVPPDFQAYRERSEVFRSILESFTPVVEPLSLDEAFCDVSAAHALFGSSESIGALIRSRVRTELGFTCSVGGGPTKLVAKLASRACKPDGMCIVDDASVFLGPLPVSALWGVGERVAEACRRMGIVTVADIAATPERVLVRTLGDALGRQLADLAHGRDSRRVTPDLEAKSVGAEETFDTDLSSDERIRAEVLRLADRVASRLVASGVSGRTITLKVRLSGFDTYTRSRTLAGPTSDVWTIYRVARELYDAFSRGSRRVRLVGVSMSALVRGPVARQLTLEQGPRYDDAEQAVARIRKRFGPDAVSLARLVEGEDPK